MRICESWCDHVECNKIRKNCPHLIEHRQFMDWEVNGHTLALFGKCSDCLMYVTKRITRSKEFQKLMVKQTTVEKEGSLK